MAEVFSFFGCLAWVQITILLQIDSPSRNASVSTNSYPIHQNKSKDSDSYDELVKLADVKSRHSGRFVAHGSTK